MKLLWVATALAISADARAECAMTELVPVRLTPDGAKLPTDGGVLVGYQSHRPEKTAHGPLAASFKATDGKAAIELAVRQIAPGVFVYSAKDPSKGSFTLMDGKTKVGTFARGATDKNDLAAPDATAGRLHMESGFHAIVERFDVDVAAIPDGALGVIVYDDKGTATSFETVPHDRTGKTTIQPFRTPSRCSFDPDGRVAPKVGAKVTIAWVDQFGRIGPPSHVITVAE